MIVTFLSYLAIFMLGGSAMKAWILYTFDQEEKKFQATMPPPAPEAAAYVPDPTDINLHPSLRP